MLPWDRWPSCDHDRPWTGHLDRHRRRGQPNLLLSALLIPPFGMVGAALASTTSLIAWNLILVVRVRQRLGIDSTCLGWKRRSQEWEPSTKRFN